MVTAARSRLIRFTFIIQNYAQLTQVYGKENAETIKGNCNIMYLISSELQALEELSKLCGEVKSKEKDKTASTPLVTVSDLQRLQQYETISLRLRKMPFKTKLVPNWKMDWGKKYEKATYPSREKRPVELFDIREFVKEQKKKKMNEMMGQSNGEKNMMGNSMFGANPLFGANPIGGMNPFGMPPSNPTNGGNGFNVDDLVKRIDAKIAELEEEERKEKEAQEKQKQAPIPTPVIDTTPVVNTPQPIEKESVTEPTTSIVTEPPVNKENSGAISLDELSEQKNTKLYEDETDDERFFDDFFSDE